MQPAPPGAPYGAYPPTNYSPGAQPAPVPNYAYYPGGQNYSGQLMMHGQQQGVPNAQQLMYDKKGKPYTIVYKDGKPKKKKWKKAALGEVENFECFWLVSYRRGALMDVIGCYARNKVNALVLGLIRLYPLHIEKLLKNAQFASR